LAEIWQLAIVYMLAGALQLTTAHQLPTWWLPEEWLLDVPCLLATGY